MEPQEPPNTIHFEIPRWLRRASMSETRSQVVFSMREAWGVERPEPRCSRRIER